MKSILPLLFALFTFNLLASCDMAPQGSCDPSLPGCSVPPDPAADDDDSTDTDDDDATTEPTPTPECDPEILDDIVEEIECPTGTFPANVSVTCEDGNWEVQLNCPPFPPEAVENDCDANLNAATLSCLAGGGSLDTFECSSEEYTFSCEYPEADPEMSCDELAALATATCSPATVVELNCSLLQFACDTDDDGSGDINIQITVNQDGDVTVTTGDDSSSSGDDDDTVGDDDDTVGDDDDTVGDDDDTTVSDDDDDDTTPPVTDVLGNYGCTHPYTSAVIAWIAANGLPLNLVRQDNDSDGVYDEIWVSATLPWTQLGLLDLDNNGSVDSSSWTCTSWADGTDDAVDNDGDGWSENDGDLDDGASGNNPNTTDTCGDAVDNDYDGALDEECTNDIDGDGYTELGGDCNDAASTVNPVGAEYNNGIDDDCDGSVDEASSVDTDGDGYCEDGVDNNADGDCRDSGEPSASVYDCAEGNPNINPGEFDWGGDGVDQDCDGTDD